MSDCDCCGCELENNYRGQRVAPPNVSFAAWCNANRDFTNLISPDALVRVDDDAGGPTHLVSGGGWVPLIADPFDTRIKDGSLELQGVFGNTYQIAATANLAIGAFGQSLSASSLPRDKFLQRLVDLAFGGITMTTRGIGPASAPMAIEYASSAGLADEGGKPGIITALAPAGGRDTGGAFGGPPYGITQPFGISPVVFSGFYYKNPVRLQGAGCKLYRNGELVWQAIRPAADDSLQHTTEDGVYLWVSDVSEASDPPWTGTGADSRTRQPSPFRQMLSFVVDKEQPIIGINPPNDCFADDRSQVAGTQFYFTATKPLKTKDTLGSEGRAVFPPLDSPANNRLVRPLYGSNGASFRWYLFADGEFLNPVQELGNLGVGTFTVEPGFLGVSTDRIAARVTEFVDLPGNTVASSPSFPVTVHAVPANNRRGARPLLEDVGLQTREYCRARLQSEPVQTVRLRFDRKVDPSGVDAAQVTLKKDGAVVPGCTISQLNELEWLITLPQAAVQTPKSFWLLEYDPSGDVMTDDIDEQSYASLAAFPPLSQSVYRRVYVAADTGLRYSKAPTQYVPVGDGPPTDANGVAFEPEPSVLACRISWLMASENGWLAPIDTANTTVLIGATASISKELEELPQPDGVFSIQSTGGVINNNWGQTRKGIETDGFTPQVPPQSDSPADCSFWGLATTIHPCPPKTLRCPVAKVAQRHASVVRREQDLTSFDLTLEGGGQQFFTANLQNQANGNPTSQNTWYWEDTSSNLTPFEPSFNDGPGGFGWASLQTIISSGPGNYGVVYVLTDGSKYIRTPGGWQAWSEGQPIIGADGEPLGSTGPNGSRVWVSMCRNASQYHSLETSFLWELEIYVRKIDASRAFIGGIIEDNASQSAWIITLSKDKEDEWNSEGSVSVRTGGFLWTFDG